MSRRPSTPSSESTSNPESPSTPRPPSITSKQKYRPATECVLVESSVRDGFGASSVPIYQTATFKAVNAAGDTVDGYDYSRSGNPTRTHLEVHLAKLMGASRSFALSSGMACLDLITRLCPPSCEIIAGNDLYGGTNRLLTFLNKSMGITIHHVDTCIVEEVEKKLKKNVTRLVLLETPTNPMMRVCDIAKISTLVHTVCNDPEFPCWVVVDNTMMSPYLQRPLELGADIVYHSGTKYLSGHHDLMAGVVGCIDSSLAEKLYFLVNATGIGLPPFDCFLLLRGVKTLSVRLEKQQANTVVLANWLYRRGWKVHYPGLPSFPWNQVHFNQASGGGAVLSFETGSVERSERIVEGGRIFGISVSFGCVNSLISMPCRMSHASIPQHVREERALPEDLIRLCVGIEDVRDLIDDLANSIIQSCGNVIAPYGIEGDRLVQIDEDQKKEIEKWKNVDDSNLVIEIAKEFSIRL